MLSLEVDLSSKMYSSTSKMGRSTDMIGSIDDIDTLMNHQLDGSFRSLDIDNVFMDDCTSRRSGIENRQMQYQSMQMRESINAFRQQNYITKNSNPRQSSIIPEVVESVFSNTMDRASTLGSFSLSTYSLDNTQHTDNELQNAGYSRGFSSTIGLGSVPSESSNKFYVHSRSDGSDMKKDPLSLTGADFSDNKHNSSSSCDVDMTSNLNDSGEVANDGKDASVKDISSDTIPNDTDISHVPGETSSSNEVGIKIPTVNDVLLGRGGRNNQWSGNEKLRHLALEMSGVYKGSAKRNKPSIAWSLVLKMRALQPPSRFLKQNQGAGDWYIVSDEVAREKASQCLRDIVASRSKIGSDGDHGQVRNLPFQTKFGTVQDNSALDQLNCANPTEQNAERAKRHSCYEKPNQLSPHPSQDSLQSNLSFSKRQVASAPNISSLLAKRSRMSDCTPNATFPSIMQRAQMEGQLDDSLAHRHLLSSRPSKVFSTSTNNNIDRNAMFTMNQQFTQNNFWLTNMQQQQVDAQYGIHSNIGHHFPPFESNSQESKNVETALSRMNFASLNQYLRHQAAQTIGSPELQTASTFGGTSMGFTMSDTTDTVSLHHHSDD